MKNPKSLLALLIMMLAVAAMLTGPMLRADDKDAGKDKDDDDDAPKNRRVVFKPPTSGAPAARTGGASRGGGPRLWVYGSIQTGLTLSAKPRFYWYQDADSKNPMVFTIIAHDAEKALYTTVIDNSHEKGVHSFDMSTQGVELVTDVEYEWSIRIPSDKKDPSIDPYSSGWIKRVALSDDMKHRIESASKDDKPAFFAGEGIWYDSLMSIDDLLATDPSARWLRIELLKQEKLKDAAKFERSMIQK